MRVLGECCERLYPPFWGVNASFFVGSLLRTEAWSEHRVATGFHIGGCLGEVSGKPLPEGYVTLTEAAKVVEIF